jgi:probable rRNA maturation factor
MIVNIQLADDVNSPLELNQIESAASQAMHMAGAPPDSELTVVLTDDEELHRLNQQFLEIDAPTDVLSFPADFIDPDSHHPYLGDILISVERARQQSGLQGHSARQELLLLIVHGILHLLGHDHAEEAEKERMWALQEQILSQLLSDKPE